MFIFNQKKDEMNLIKEPFTECNHSEIVPISQVNEEIEAEFSRQPKMITHKLFKPQSLLTSKKESSTNYYTYGGCKIPKLSENEMEVLRYCHNHDMMAVLREEFEKNPIDQSSMGGFCSTNI